MFRKYHQYLVSPRLNQPPHPPLLQLQLYHQLLVYPKSRRFQQSQQFRLDSTFRAQLWSKLCRHFCSVE